MKTITKIGLFGCLPIVSLFFIFIVVSLITSVTTEEEIRAKNPSQLSTDSIKSFVGQTFPYEWSRSIGGHQTDDATDQNLWVVVIDSAKVSMIVDKTSDLVIYAALGKEKAAEEKSRIDKSREDKLKTSFSGWDGSHIELTKYIKRQLNDPSSYEHLSTRYWYRGDHIVVLTQYSAKNGFGGRVKASIRAKCDIETGAVLEILE